MGLRSAFQEYVVVSPTEPLQVLENKEGLPWSSYLGVLGIGGAILVVWSAPDD